MSTFSSLQPAVQERVDAYWSEWLACSRDELRGPHTRVRPHGPSLRDYPAVFIFASHAAPLVSLPPSVYDTLAERAARWSVDDVRNPERLGITPHTPERVVGPAFLGYTTLVPTVSATNVRRLDESDQALLDDLRDACPTDWEHGGMDFAEGVLFGAFTESGNLGAFGGYKPWPHGLAHLYVVSHPSQRSKGLATQAVAAAMSHALAAGLVAQYRTLETNAASLAIARKLGFLPYGFTVALYLRQENMW